MHSKYYILIINYLIIRHKYKAKEKEYKVISITELKRMKNNIYDSDT